LWGVWACGNSKLKLETGWTRVCAYLHEDHGVRKLHLELTLGALRRGQAERVMVIKGFFAPPLQKNN